MSYWLSPEGRARKELALSQYELFVCLCFEDGDLDDLGHDDQYSKSLEMAEHHCEVDVLSKAESLAVFDKVRTSMGANTPPGAKHRRVVDSDESSDDDSEVSDLDISDRSERDDDKIINAGRGPVESSDDSDSDSESDVPVRAPAGKQPAKDDSESSDEEIVFSGVRPTYYINQKVDKGLVYKPETLVSMIPQTADFDRLRRSIGILRISSRLLPGMSNRRARAILFKKGHDVRTWPRHEYREVLPYPFRDKGSPFGGKPIRVLGLIQDNVVVREVTTGAPYSARRFLKRNLRKVAKLSYDPVKGVCRRIAIVEDDTVKVLGGMTYPRKRWIIPGRIDPAHKKYWYFLRKNGRVYRSVHHPYDDE